jgi:hypothetical protein
MKDNKNFRVLIVYCRIYLLFCVSLASNEQHDVNLNAMRFERVRCDDVRSLELFCVLIV